MKWIRIILINAFVFCILMLTLELGARLLATAKDCYVSSSCSLNRIISFKVKDASLLGIGLSRYDKSLGYVPREGFDGIVNLPPFWDHVRVTVSDDGFRSNGSSDANKDRGSQILAVGDSFTFGDQVANQDTWVACLERKTKLGVANGGVFGYGSAQALLRAKVEEEKHKYNVIILSILVEDDFYRDQLRYRYGFPRPALIKDGDKVIQAEVDQEILPGTKYNPAKHGKAFIFVYEHSIIFATIIDRLFPSSSPVPDLDLLHPKAANIEEIVNWTLTNFNSIKGPRKVLLLQYGALGIKDPKTLQLRDTVLLKANRLGLEVVDTYTVLKDANSKEVWDGHHTPMGNRLVCDYLYQTAFSE